jgi:uncharacterized protein
VDCPTEKLIQRDTTGRYKKALGFKFVVLDLEPFRSGRLNEAAGISLPVIA